MYRSFTAAAAVTIAFAAALPAQAADRAAALDVHGLWRIDQAESEPILDRRHARIDFRRDGKLIGHTSCNEMSASYTLHARKLELGPVATATKNACGQLQLEQEDRILTALENVVDAHVRDDGLLELRDRDGRGLLRGTRFEGGKR